MNGIDFDGREFANVAGAGVDDEVSVGITGKVAVLVRKEAINEPKMGSKDA